MSSDEPRPPERSADPEGSAVPVSQLPVAELKPECRDVLDRVYAFVDGEVPEDDVEAIRAHLEGCAPCLAEYDLEAAVKALVRRSCQDRAPDHLRTKVLTRITELRAQFDTAGGSQVELTEVRVTTSEG